MVDQSLSRVPLDGEHTACSRGPTTHGEAGSEVTTTQELHGRLVDLDSHWMMWPEQIQAILGPDLITEFEKVLERTVPAGRVADTLARQGGANPRADAVRPRLEAMRKRARAEVWNVKGWAALGAQDPVERLDALDKMGIAHQLVFPTGMWAALLTDHPLARAAVARYNDEVLAWAAPAKGRLRPACLINAGEFDAAVSEAERVIAAGAPALQLPCHEPPAGISPAHPRWDPLYAACAEAGVPVLFHLGGNTGFIDPGYEESPTLVPPEPLEGSDPGESANAFRFATVHMSTETHLTAMLLGGVFERHPELRVGVIELGASWVGPWAARLDRTARIFHKRVGKFLTQEPSAYIRRQIRVTPFIWEPVGEMIDHHGLEEVYLFSTDYPHPEGGRDPIGTFERALGTHDGQTVERFFITNGLDLLPA